MNCMECKHYRGRKNGNLNCAILGDEYICVSLCRYYEKGDVE